MSRRVAIAALAPLLVLLAACVPEPSSSTPAPTVTIGRSPSASVAATPTPTPTSAALPADCRAIVSDDVLAQFGDTPLNDPATGAATGVQPDGSLACLWRHPSADTTYLQTTISRMYRGEALDLMNQLADGEGYTCYTPAGGTRCEKSWIDDTYPVQDGRTLFWRDDVLIDTEYSNLAPAGYTDSIVAHLFN